MLFSLEGWGGEVIDISMRCVSCSVVSDSLRPHRLYATGLLCPRDFPGKDTGMGCHFFLQGIFLSQGSNPCSWSPVSPALQVESLPLSHQGQRVVVSPTSMEGNSCCATKMRTCKAFLSVPSGLLEGLVIWPALSDHCTLPPGTSEKKEGFGFDWDRLKNIINGGREDNYPINKRHGGDRHIQNQAWLWNKSDSRRVVIYLFISLRFPHLLSLSLIWADSPYPNFPLCPRSAMAASGTISAPTVHSSHCRKPPILFLPPFGMLISLSYLIGTLILEISLQRYWIPAYEMQSNRI